MRFYSRKLQINFAREVTPVVKYLLIANGVMYVFFHLFGESANYWIEEWFVLSRYSVFPRFQIWKIVTYMFLHANFWHFLFNMLVLWMFGCDVEYSLGSRRFLRFYVYSGISAGLLHILIISSEFSTLVGASGAIYGVMIAFALLFRERIINLLIFFVIPVQMKAKYLIALLFGISILMFLIFGSESRIAHFAHLGGALFGLAYFYVPGYLYHFSAYLKDRREMQIQKSEMIKNQNLEHIREEIDIILDKINEIGYENLSDEEKKVLKEYSKLLPEKDDK